MRRVWPRGLTASGVRTHSGDSPDAVRVLCVSTALPSRRVTAASMLLLAAGVAVALGVYAKQHSPTGRPIFTLGFSGMLQMKAWLTTIALALVVVQLLTALWMWRRLPAAGAPPGWVS